MPAPAVVILLVWAVAPYALAEERQRPSIGALESRTHELVNEHRGSAQLPQLEYSRAIAEVARRHSEDMAAGRVRFGHDGARSRWRAIERSAPIGGMAENVAANTLPAAKTAQAAVSGWLDSPGHRENIEGDYDVTGVGIARDAPGTWYYTQIFVKRRGRP